MLAISNMEDALIQKSQNFRSHVRRFLGAFLGLGLITEPVAAQAACLRGINLAGAEFGKLGDIYEKGYIYPSAATIGYFADKGFNIVRLPFLWERLQPQLYKGLDSVELRRLRDTVKAIRASGMAVILDPHNYARFRGQLIGSDAVPQSAFADFWRRLAGAFSGVDGIAFGLMNEPYDISAEDWLSAANSAIGAIRQTGAANLVLVPGTAWSGAHSWIAGDYGTPNGSVMLGVTDPKDNYAYELHQYLDTDFSGKNEECTRAADAVKAIGDVANWLRHNHQRGFLGEFAVPTGQTCQPALVDMVKAVEQNADVWLGWSYWAGGDWWPEEEPLNIQPVTKAGKQADRPQMQTLSRILSEQASCSR